ncbi:hypothetical protein IJ732_07370, partial [bacterium]|nr:hypothetical protein [bacterium]
MTEKVLQGGVEYYEDVASIKMTKEPQYNVPEDTNILKNIVYTTNSVKDVVYQSSMKIFSNQGFKNSITGIRFIDSNFLAPWLIGLDILTSAPQEGLRQATITAILSSGATVTVGNIAIYMLTPLTVVLPTLTPIIAFTFAAAVGYKISNYIDKKYDEMEEKYLNFKYNESSDRLMLVTNEEDISVIAKLIEDIAQKPELSQFVNKISVKQIINNKEKIYTLENYNLITQMAENNLISEDVIFENNPWLKNRTILQKFVLVCLNESVKMLNNAVMPWFNAISYNPRKSFKNRGLTVSNVSSTNSLRPEIHLMYNHHDVSETFKPFIKSIKYEDFLEDRYDSLVIEMSDPDGRFD